MASRKIQTNDDEGLTSTIFVQGFQGGGVVEPYVYLGLQHDENEEYPDLEVMLTASQANELGEYLRQEAEFAQSEQEEN